MVAAGVSRSLLGIHHLCGIRIVFMLDSVVKNQELIERSSASIQQCQHVKCGCHRGYSISSVSSFTVVYMGLRRTTYKAPSFLSRTRHPCVVCALPRQVTSSCQPRGRLTMGDRAFAVAGPRAWNKLPDSVRQSSSLDVFKRLLKSKNSPVFSKF